MAKQAYTRKSFQYRVEIDGIDEFEIQKVSIPSVEIDVVEHGDTNRAIKTAGMVKTGDLVLEKIRPIGNDSWAYNELALAQNVLTGGGTIPVQFKKPIVIKEMDSTGFATLNRWLCTGCWVKKIESSDLDRMSSDAIIETVTFSVDECVRA